MHTFTVKRWAILGLMILLPFSVTLSQNMIIGTVLDADTEESIIGAMVLVADTSIGTITEFDGSFAISTELSFPLTLRISFLGYRPTDVIYTGSSEKLVVRLEPEYQLLRDEIVISASRLEERILEAPVSIQKVSSLDIRHTPTADLYSSLAALKGIKVNTAGLTFQSVNTRGFADIQNWRFVQLTDGMDLNLPGLGYASANLIGTSELDIQSIEIVPGAGSALYGPNAFNGLMHTYTKNPFDYHGVSFYTKLGATEQTEVGNNPFVDVGFRVAKVLNPKLAFKINVSHLEATDWEARDLSYHITPARAGLQDQLLATPFDAPLYDAVNIYGDEVVVPIDLLGDGNIVEVSRTGFWERDIVDYGINLTRINGAVHYRPHEKLELMYAGKWVEGDAILRHTTVYPFVNVQMQAHKLEARHENFLVRTYFTKEDAKDTYQLLATGAFIQEGLKPSETWATEYATAYRGLIPGVTGMDHQAARLFADRDIPGPESSAFQALRTATLTNPDLTTFGSQFVDRSSLWHSEGTYDFSTRLRNASLLVGASARRYHLDSDGQVFNDGANGFGQPIVVWEHGAFVQGGLSLIQDRLNLKASARYDKNTNFEGRITPRAAAVLSLGQKRNHNFRLSAQTGFRNPAPQETYIALAIPGAVLLGGTEDNISQYNYIAADQSSIPGTDIYNSLVTIGSLTQFLAGGSMDPTLLEPANLSFLKQEQVLSFEAGYKALITPRLFVDLNVYHNTYRNFVTRVNAYSLLAGTVFSVYTNIDDPITSIGGGIGAGYGLKNGLRIDGNYTFASFDADEALANNPDFLPAFNLAQHQFNVQLQHRNLYKGLGLSAAYRWVDQFEWQSPFGVGMIPQYQVVDAAVSYDLADLGILLKLGGSNLFNDPYQLMYGGPQIGRQYFLSVTFDNWLMRN